MVSLRAFTVLVFVGCALGDQGDTPGCSIVTRKGVPAKGVLQYKTDGCMVDKLQGHLSSVEQRNLTAEEFRKALRDFCSERSEVEACWARVAAEEPACVTAEDSAELSLYRTFKATELEVGCVHDGERVAVIFEHTDRLHRESPDNRTLVEHCQQISEALTHPYDLVADRYRSLEATRKCLKKQPQDDLVTAALSLTEEILDRMQCARPEDGSLTLCKAILS